MNTHSHLNSEQTAALYTAPMNWKKLGIAIGIVFSMAAAGTVIKNYGNIKEFNRSALSTISTAIGDIEQQIIFRAGR